MSPLLLPSNDQNIPCPERHENDGRSEKMHHLTGKLSPQGHDSKQSCHETLQTLVLPHMGF